jgi:hypothetical protein
MKLRTDQEITDISCVIDASAELVFLTFIIYPNLFIDYQRRSSSDSNFSPIVLTHRAFFLPVHFEYLKFDVGFRRSVWDCEDR